MRAAELAVAAAATVVFPGTRDFRDKSLKGVRQWPRY